VFFGAGRREGPWYRKQSNRLAFGLLGHVEGVGAQAASLGFDLYILGQRAVGNPIAFFDGHGVSPVDDDLQRAMAQSNVLRVYASVVVARSAVRERENPEPDIGNPRAPCCTRVLALPRTLARTEPSQSRASQANAKP